LPAIKIIERGEVLFHVLFLPLRQTWLFIYKIVLFLFSLTVLFIPFFIVKKNFRNFLVMRKQIRIGHPGIFEIQSIKSISENLKTKVPLVVFSDAKKLDAQSSYIGFPYFNNLLIIPKSTLETLTEEQLEGLIAHEMWHIKKHTLKFRLLILLSEWTLMGKCFLVSVLNPVKMEFEADDFAVSWLEKKGISKEAYTEVLKKIEIYNAGVSMKRQLQTSLGILNTSTQDMGKDKKDDFITKAKHFFDLYLGEEIISYIYPSTEERIARIMGREYGT
jgi:Zn-dependent protease with chaperone function